MATSSCTAVDDSMATTSSSSPVLGNRVRALTRQFDDQSGRSTPPPLPCREKPQPAARKRSLPSQAQASPAAPAPRDSCDTPPLTQAPQRSSSSQSVNETGRRRSLPAPPLPPPTATEQETSVEEGGAVVPSKPARRPRLLPKPSLKPTAKPPLPPLIEGQYSSLDSDYTSMYDAMPSPASAEVAPLRFNLNSTDVVQKTKTTTSTHSLDDYNSVIDITTSDAVDGTYEGGSERAMEDNRSEEVVVQRRSLENKSHGTTIGTISLDNSLLDFAIDLCDKNIPLKPPSVPPTSTIPATAALHDENEHERPPSQTETTVELLNAAEASILQHIDVSQPAPFIALPSEQHHTSTVNTNTARNISRPKSASLTLERVKSHLKSSSTDLLRFVPRPSASPAFLRRARSAARPKSPSAAFLNPVTDKLQSIDDDVPLPPTRTSSILPLLYPDAPPVPPHAPRCSAPPPLYATTPDSDNGFSSEEEEEELDVSATQPDSAPSSSGFGDEDVFLNEGDDVYECLVAADGPICSPQTEKPVVEPIYDTRYAFSEPIPLYQDYPDVRVRRIETFALGEQRPTQPAVNEDMAKLLRSSPLHSSTGANLSRVESQRPLWCNLPAVEASGVLDAMSDQQRGAQEAMFELITSEASYLRSLDVLIEHFMANTQLTPTAAKRASIPHYTPQSSLDEPVLITPLQRRQLFGNIIAIRDGSQKLMNDFVTILQSGPTLTGVCEAWLRHMHCDSPLADKYARYHRNSVFQQRTLSELRDPSHPACPLLTSLEHSLRAQVSDPGIRALSVHSFLILPMQTVTRYHLLLSAILQRLDADAEERETTQEAKRHALKQSNLLDEITELLSQSRVALLTIHVMVRPASPASRQGRQGGGSRVSGSSVSKVRGKQGGGIRVSDGGTRGSSVSKVRGKQGGSTAKMNNLSNAAAKQRQSKLRSNLKNSPAANHYDDSNYYDYHNYANHYDNNHNDYHHAYDYNNHANHNHDYNHDNHTNNNNYNGDYNSDDYSFP